MLVLITYLLLSVAVVLFARKKRIGVVQVFLVSLFFTPLTGIFYILHADPVIKYHHYSITNNCSVCNMKLTQDQLECPNCGAQAESEWGVVMEV